MRTLFLKIQKALKKTNGQSKFQKLNMNKQERKSSTINKMYYYI